MKLFEQYNMNYLLEKIVFVIVILFIIIFCMVIITETIERKFPEAKTIIEEPFPVREHYNDFSGFISTEEYMASFQQFNEGSFWVRVSREGHEKIEFEVTSWDEAVLFMEGLK